MRLFYLPRSWKGTSIDKQSLFPFPRRLSRIRSSDFVPFFFFSSLGGSWHRILRGRYLFVSHYPRAVDPERCSSLTSNKRACTILYSTFISRTRVMSNLINDGAPVTCLSNPPAKPAFFVSLYPYIHTYMHSSVYCPPYVRCACPRQLYFYFKIRFHSTFLGIGANQARSNRYLRNERML